MTLVHNSPVSNARLCLKTLAIGLAATGQFGTGNHINLCFMSLALSHLRFVISTKMGILVVRSVHRHCKCTIRLTRTKQLWDAFMISDW